MEITKIVVMLTDGADIIFVHTNLPSSMPAVTNLPLILQCSCQRDKGVEYVRSNFGKEPEVINDRG